MTNTKGNQWLVKFVHINRTLNLYSRWKCIRSGRCWKSVYDTVHQREAKNNTKKRSPWIYKSNQVQRQQLWPTGESELEKQEKRFRARYRNLSSKYSRNWARDAGLRSWPDGIKGWRAECDATCISKAASAATDWKIIKRKTIQHRESQQWGINNQTGRRHRIIET